MAFLNPHFLKEEQYVFKTIHIGYIPWSGLAAEGYENNRPLFCKAERDHYPTVSR
jgi:hypothetical protein